MLNPFPDLLSYSFFAPLILRVVAGLIFLDLGYVLFKKEKDSWIKLFQTLKIPFPKISIKIFGGVEFLGGLMLIAGFYTQIASLVLSIITFIECYLEYKEPVLVKRNLTFYIMLLTITLSLLISGAGAFAFDLPL